MSAITLRLPDDKHQRLKILSEQRGISINQILNEMTTLLILILKRAFESEPSVAKGKLGVAYSCLKKQ